MHQNPSVYMSKRLHEAAKRALDEELLRLKQDPKLAGARVAPHECLHAVLYSLLSLASGYAGGLLDLDVSVSDQESQATVRRIEEALIPSVADIMRHELRKRGGTKDPSWPNLHHGHA
jgi:hypothetical protein